MNLFLDTNALIKIYHQEKGTENFTQFLSDVSGELIITISDLTHIEVHSVFLKKYREKKITKTGLTKIFELLDKDFQKFNVVVSDQFIKNIALQLIDNIGTKYNLTTLDSFQLASAVYFNNYSKIDSFVSSDKKLLNIAKEFFQIINPEEM